MAVYGVVVGVPLDLAVRFVCLFVFSFSQASNNINSLVLLLFAESVESRIEQLHTLSGMTRFFDYGLLWFNTPSLGESTLFNT